MKVAYKLEISKEAQADLKKLDKEILEAVRNRLTRLTNTVDEIVHLPLKGEFTRLYKLRVRKNYRVIYDLNREEELIVVVQVGKRSDIYRR